MDDKNSQQLLEELQTLNSIGGVNMNDLLNVSDELRQVFVWMIRQNGFQAEDMETYLGLEDAHVRELLEILVEKGLVEEVSTTQRFYANISPTRAGRKYRVSNDLWKALE